MFKTITGPPTKTIKLTDDAANALELRRTALSEELGFSVTAAEAVMWMLKHFHRYTNLPTMVMVDTSVGSGTPGRGYWNNTAVPVAIQNEIEKLMVHGQKIPAIKYAREQFGWGLKESKEYVELWPDGRQPLIPS